MFNNAGVLAESKPEVTVNANLLGCIYGTEIASTHMRKDRGGKGGRIINMSSKAGLTDLPNVPTYCATKHGVRTYTISKSNHPSVEDTGVEYAVLFPGCVLAGLYLKLIEDRIAKQGKPSVARNEYLEIPLSRLLDGFLKLVTLEKMNGAMLEVTPDEDLFVRMEKVVIGSTYPPSL
ncbi:15-hydroxyprostaglandin dehydrogenase [Elysia marginata]|uniref:15-hydroxyprostaglandin dehydrogenase [NAD(+)] n=1 Tax=Elysia marginata TaxID=1093978 RepID=A0AAV4IQK7_9GAST|nr:15-hydroxyprostaglandin dehydrogenase [Elysia marginata]